MATGALLYDIVTDVGTASAGSVASATGTPASAVLDPQLEIRWRSAAGVTSTWLLVDIGAQRAIDTVALFGTALTSSASLRVRLSTADATGAAGDAHDSGTIAAGADPQRGGAAIYLIGTAVYARYVRVDISDGTLPWLEVGRLVAGARWRFARNYRLGWTIEAVDDAHVAVTWGGHEWRDGRRVRRRVRVELPAITRAEYELHGQALLAAGGSRDVLLLLDQASTALPRDSVFGRLAPVALRNPYPGHYTAVLDLTERM